MLIDSHCHLDDKALSPWFETVQKAKTVGVTHIVIPSVAPNNFEVVQNITHQNDCLSYALGIHPLYVSDLSQNVLNDLEIRIQSSLNDPCFIGIGEIGLDYFVESMTKKELKAKQIYFFTQQLKLAKRYELPVLIHSRRAVDDVLKFLNQFDVHLGIAHAFSGSLSQGLRLIRQGLKLSFCGTITYERAKQRQFVLQHISEKDFVLETDAPDLPPLGINKKENSPVYLPTIAINVAKYRRSPLDNVKKQAFRNTLDAIPRLKKRLNNVITL